MNQIELDAVKQRAVQYLAERPDLSDAKFANAVGVSPSAFSQFKRDAYQGNVEAIANAINDYINTEIGRNETPAEFHFVETNVAMQVRDAMKLATTLKRMVIITSPPGDGKTEALRHYATTAQTIFMTGRSTMNTLNMLGELAERIKVSTKNNADMILRRLIGAFSEKPRTLVIDEAQHLRVRSLDALRAIWDSCRIPIILAGNDELISTMQSDQRMQQFLSRLQHFRVQRISFEDAKALIVQRFPGMSEAHMRSLYTSSTSTRMLCDFILALDLLCKMQNLREPNAEMLKQVKPLKFAA
jgi:hypothetical protein